MKTFSTQKLTPTSSSRPTITSSSERPGWQTRATTRVWQKTSSLAARAPPPQWWCTVSDDSPSSSRQWERNTEMKDVLFAASACSLHRFHSAESFLCGVIYVHRHAGNDLKSAGSPQSHGYHSPPLLYSIQDERYERLKLRFNWVQITTGSLAQRADWFLFFKRKNKQQLVTDIPQGICISILWHINCLASS